MDLSVHGTSACPPPFDIEAERLLKPLCGMRIRASLFAINVRTLPVEETLTLMRAALSDVGLTGLRNDGGVGLLYVGPRSDGPDGDRAIELWIAALVQRAIHGGSRGGRTAGIDIVAVHRTLDQVDACDEPILELAQAQRNRAADTGPCAG